MRKFSFWKSIAFLAMLCIGLSSCDNNDEGATAVDLEQKSNIETDQVNRTLTEIVVESESLSLLEAALVKTGLDETLSGAGPFTVLAPTDDAFEILFTVLGDSVVDFDDIEGEAEIEWLRKILLYHVIPAEVKAADLSEGFVETALKGSTIQINASGETFTIGDGTPVDADITATDILGSNGVIHTIDKLLLPREALDYIASLNLKDIVEQAVKDNDLEALVDGLLQDNMVLVDSLGEEEPFTVFAPNQEAFEALLNTLGDDYNDISDFDTEVEQALLVTILSYHAVPGNAVFAADVTDGQVLETLQGENITIRIGDGTVKIDDATPIDAVVTIADVEASNGVVHLIDKVLIPQEVLDLLSPLVN